jgi:hypothetical protein
MYQGLTVESFQSLLILGLESSPMARSLINRQTGNKQYNKTK